MGSPHLLMITQWLSPPRSQEIGKRFRKNLKLTRIRTLSAQSRLPLQQAMKAGRTLPEPCGRLRYSAHGALQATMPDGRSFRFRLPRWNRRGTWTAPLRLRDEHRCKLLAHVGAFEQPRRLRARRGKDSAWVPRVRTSSLTSPIALFSLAAEDRFIQQLLVLQQLELHLRVFPTYCPPLFFA